MFVYTVSIEPNQREETTASDSQHALLGACTQQASLDWRTRGGNHWRRDWRNARHDQDRDRGTGASTHQEKEP